MDYEEIIGVIQQASGGPGVLSGEAAERAAQATLAERLPRAEAWHILQEVPAELKPWIYTETEAEKFDFDEFLDRVAKREDTDIETALRHGRAVFSALGRALGAEVVAHMTAVLPQTFDLSCGGGAEEIPGPGARRMPLEEFLQRVAGREGAVIGEAALFSEIFEHARAVFATLAEAVGTKEWFDVVVELREDCHGLIPARYA